MAKNMRTHSAGLQYHHPLISPRSPQVLGRGKQMKAGVYNHGLTSGVPPLLVASPLTERAIWAAESQRQAYPSLCPALWARSQRDRLGELAGTSAPRSLAKLQHVLMILAFSEVKNVHDSLYLTRRLVSVTLSDWSRMCPNCCFKVTRNPSYLHMNIYYYTSSTIIYILYLIYFLSWLVYTLVWLVISVKCSIKIPVLPLFWDMSLYLEHTRQSQRWTPGGRHCCWRCDAEIKQRQLPRDFKYPLARLIMVDRKVRAHNLLSSLDNNWEVGTECDEKIKIIIVFLLELKGFFLFFFFFWFFFLVWIREKSFQLKCHSWSGSERITERGAVWHQTCTVPACL